jgi:hypothetical protein
MKRKHRIIPRILITLLGIGLIFMGMSGIMLGFAGKSAHAVITDIRREGGERADGKPGRYTAVARILGRKPRITTNISCTGTSNPCRAKAFFRSLLLNKLPF